MQVAVHPERVKPLVTENATFRSLYDFTLTEQDMEQARSELGETTEKRDACLKKLKKMLSSDDGVQYRTDDDYILRYLRWRKYDCDRAYNTLKKFQNLRTKNPEYFSLPSNFEHLLKMGAVKCLSHRDEKGSIVFNVDSRKWDLEHMSFCNLQQVSNAVSDVISMNPSSQVNSIIGFWDLGGLTPRHFSQCLTFNKMKMIIQCLTDSHPWRIRRVILFNCNVVIRTVYRLIISSISKKIADRMKFLGSDVSELHEYINPAILPKEYGGYADDDGTSVFDFVLDNLKYLEYERSFYIGRETTSPNKT